MPNPPRLESPKPSAEVRAANSYDEVPYESHPYPQTHPSRLATVATLFGLQPPPVNACRVLELGCAAGGNLIPMAEALPGSWFVGLDLSARQIGDGEQVLRRLGLENISLRHASIEEVDDSYGCFDYILCHGVYSWVEDRVREKILEICSRRLTPRGIAYVSYNTYPGWHMRGMIRDMMRYHALRFETPDQRIHQARALLDFLARSVRQDGTAYATLLRTELDALKKQSDHYLYHEHLEDVNAPVYFHEFLERAERHGLRYLGEARLTTMVIENFTPDVRKALETLANDQTQAEQYLDFVRNRTFRETLLVRAEQHPQWGIRPAAVETLHVSAAGPITADSSDVKSAAQTQYRTPSGMVLSTSSPVLRAALEILAAAWPGTVPFADLHRQVRTMLGSDKDEREDLAMGVLNTYLSSDLLELHAMPIPAGPIGDQPAALPSVRVRLSLGELAVTTQRHVLFRANDFDVKLLPLLDGSRDRDTLLDALTEMTLSSDLRVEADGQALTEPAAIREALGPVLDKALAGYASAGLLEGRVGLV